jgi:Protein of unknown function (DUF3309)
VSLELIDGAADRAADSVAADLAVQRRVGVLSSGGLGIVLLVLLIVLLTRRRV